MIHLATGSPQSALTDDDLREALTGVLDAIGPRNKVLAVPPDNTRFFSKAGLLTCVAHEHYGPALVDVMPALGTHFPMTAAQLDRMFPGLPHDLIREHRWREDVVTVGKVPADYVREVTGGICEKAWPAQMNRLVWDGGHDLVLSIGQVVPHEGIGMANGNKNIFVGTGGQDGINESHFIGAAYGMERMMGRSDTPLRRILNYAEREFCGGLPLLYVLTVVGSDHVVRGLFVGDDPECFEAAADLAKEVNFTQLDQPLDRVVVHLDPDEFHSTWLGNKAVYRTRMAIADDGELIILAPGVAS
ncbi:MAG: lactate racemase domain-containing protein, partial [Planctomycetota bacterium]